MGLSVRRGPWGALCCEVEGIPSGDEDDSAQEERTMRGAVGHGEQPRLDRGQS